MSDVAEARRVAIEAACRPWTTEAAALVAAKVADARAHTALAITASLVATPDGRPTAARANRNRSLSAASARLDELATALAGPTVRSLDGLVRDAWEAAYRDARSYWLGVLGPDYARPSDRPSATELASARGLVLGGSDARTRLLAATDAAARRLRSLVVATASPARSARDRSGSLRAWEVATTRTVSLAAANAILTGSFRCDVLAGRAATRPEFLHPDPTVSGP